MRAEKTREKILSEISLFIVYLFCLVFSVSVLVNLRSLDAAYSASERISDSDLKTLQNKKNFSDEFLSTFVSVSTLNFGETVSGEKVSRHILERLEPTFFLALAAVSAGAFFGIFPVLYFYAGNWNYGISILRLLSEFILSTPVFTAALFLFIIFFQVFALFPPGGYVRWDISYLVLPALALGSRTFARVCLFTESEVRKEKDSAYAVFLFCRGMNRNRIFFKYIFWKIFPLISVIILLDFGSLLSGAVIVEEIYFYPGIGKSVYHAIRNFDANLLKGILFYTGIIFYSSARMSRYLQAYSEGAWSR